MRVNGGDDVEQAGDDDEFGAVIGDRGLHGCSAKADGAADEVEQAAAEIAGHAEQIEYVLRAGVELTLHGQAEHEHGDDGDGEQCASNPLAEQEMAGAGDEPSGDEGKVNEPLLRLLARGGLVWGGWHSFLTIQDGAELGRKWG